MPPDPTSLAAILEPTAVDRNYAYSYDRMTVTDASQAVSAKRAADALEAIAASLATIAQHLAPVITGTPATDDLRGWKQWHGGEKNPFGSAQSTQVKYRNGETEIGPADGFRWAHDVYHPYDIVAYRLAPAK